MEVAYFRHPDHPGQVTLITAAKVAEFHLDTSGQRYICPSCGMPAIYVGSHLNPGNKHYRAPHFRHPDQDECHVSVCDMRASVNPNASQRLSQKLRTPLFLRPDKNGKFTLSIGFRTENKSILRRLREAGYTTLTVQSGKRELLQVSLEAMEKVGKMYFADIPLPLTAKQNASTFVSGPSKPKYPADQFGLSPTIDGFSENSNGAIFEYSAGGAGEKVQSGGFVAAGRPYLLVAKDSGSVYIKPFWEQPKYKDYIQSEYLGNLLLKDTCNTYSIYKMVFPQKKGNVSATLYFDIANKLQALCATTLCDTIPEVRPLWPPASRKTDAYAVQKMGLTHETVLVDSSDGSTSIQIHKTEDDVRDLAVVNRTKATLATIPLRTTRTPVSCNGGVSSSVSSYRLEPMKEPPIPWLKITGLYEEPTMRPGLHEVKYPSNGKITVRAAADFVCYIDGKLPVTYEGGIDHDITVLPNKDVLLHGAGQRLYMLRFTIGKDNVTSTRYQRRNPYSHYHGYK